VTESALVIRWIETRELQVRRELLNELLHAGFPTELSPEVIETINQQPSVSLLHSWFKAALKARTYEDVLALLRL
jgi:hypothetical protein